MNLKEATRRDFIKSTALGAVGAGLVRETWASEAGTAPVRPLGKTGEKVSLLCLGGYHLGTVKDDGEAVDFVREAVDLGVTFMDNAWEYHKGRSEEIMGKALQDGYREKAFVMTKHHGRDKKTALQHLDDSLRKLKTDVIDLWQFHEVVYEKDPEMIFAPGGGIEAAVEAKKAGKVRYIGFTGHKDPKIHMDMLSRGFDWDATQMPLSVFDAHFQSFEKNVLPVCVERGIGVLAMKTLAAGAVVKANLVPIEDAMHYAMSLPVATVVSGMRNREELRMNAGIARRYETMTESRKAAILEKTKKIALQGDHELFKTTNRFDGPVGRKLHGVG